MAERALGKARAKPEGLDESRRREVKTLKYRSYGGSNPPLCTRRFRLV
jgi:hypothetical protein